MDQYLDGKKSIMKEEKSVNMEKYGGVDQESIRMGGQTRLIRKMTGMPQEKKLNHTQPVDHSSKPEHYEEKTSSSQGCAQKWDLQSKKFWYLAYKEKKAKVLKWKKRAERSEKKLEEIRGKIKKNVDI